jgi:hypothetical protein
MLGELWEAVSVFHLVTDIPKSSCLVTVVSVHVNTSSTHMQNSPVRLIRRIVFVIPVNLIHPHCSLLLSTLAIEGSTG